MKPAYAEVDERAGPSARMTVITAAEPVGKRLSLSPTGEMISISLGNLSDGAATVTEVDGVAGLRAVIEKSDGSTVLTYGTACRNGRVVTQKLLPSFPSAISRDRNHFRFSEAPGFLFLDFDSAADSALASGRDLFDWLSRVVPEIAGAPALWRASSSSFIHDSRTGEPVTKLRGQRLLILVECAADIPRLGQVIFDRLWLAGHGRVEVSKSGAFLLRAPVDASVWQPERLDFLQPHCEPPLEQRAPSIELMNEYAAPLNCSAIRDLSSAERRELRERQDKEREKHLPESDAAHCAWLSECVANAVRRGATREDAEESYGGAVRHGRLGGAFLLIAETGEEITVDTLLRDRKRWHGARFHDPLEPGYRGDARIAWANLLTGGTACLYSHAHGGQRYLLYPQRRVLQMPAGDLSRTADQAIEALRAVDEFYENGGAAPVRVVGGVMSIQTAASLTDAMSRTARFETFRDSRNQWVPVDPPPKLAETIMSRTGAERGFPHLNAVIDAPTLRPDGSIIESAGYDAATGLILVSPGTPWPSVPRAPSLDEVACAAAALWYPVRLFPFVDAVSRGVMMAALLTSVLRVALPTAPGFAFDAPSAGSGKTKLAHVLAALAGTAASVAPPPSNDDEIRKSLFARLRSGERVIVFDNLVGTLDGGQLPTLSAVTTSPVFSDRILGQSATQTAPNRALLVVTGNNVRIAQDLARRILVCRIDPECETPFTRRFGFDPEALARRTRLGLVAAALTVVRGYLSDREPDNEAFGPPAGGDVGSFAEWNRLVRQPVAWLGECAWLQDRWPEAPSFGDPMRSAVMNVAEDPHKVELGGMLRGWRGAFGERFVSAAEAIRGVGDDFDTAEAAKEWRAALALMDSRGAMDARRLGKWLSTHAGEIVGRLRFVVRRDSHTKTQEWRVERVA